MELFKNSLEKKGNSSAVTSMSGVKDTAVGPPAEYGGSPETLNPEELFVASINSCIMLVFYHFADKFGLRINLYRSDAEGQVEKTREGLRFTRVSVRAEVELDDDSQAEKVQEAAELAEKYCLVSNSVSCPVEYTVGISVRD